MPGWLMILHRFATGLLIVLSMVVGAVAQDRIIGVTSVVDGDTIEIHGQRIRLFGIDAPESSQLCVRPTGERWWCGQQASFALADRIGRTAVTCQPRDLDRYGRVVAVSSASGCKGVRNPFGRDGAFRIRHDEYLERISARHRRLRRTRARYSRPDT